MSASQQLLLLGGGIQENESPIWSNVVALYHGEGTNGGTTITDSSSYNHSTASWVQNVTTSTTRSRYGSACLRTDTASDNCWARMVGSTAFKKRPTYTIEFSIWVDSSLFTNGKNCVVMSRDNTMYCNVLNSGGSSFALSSSGIGMDGVSYSASGLFDQWVDVCLVRDFENSRASIYINGTRVATTTSLSTFTADTSAYDFNVLGLTSNNYGGRGIYLDELRFTQDQALHKGASYALHGSAFPDS